MDTLSRARTPNIVCTTDSEPDNKRGDAPQCNTNGLVAATTSYFRQPDKTSKHIVFYTVKI